MAKSNEDNNDSEELSYSQVMGHSKLDPQIPLILDYIKEKGFDLKEQIGVGQYSTVLKASWNRMPDKDIACKRINLSEVDEEWKDKCLKGELIIIKKLKHKNVIEVFEVFKTPKLVFIFMQLAQNGSIREFMERAQHPIKESQAKIWFTDLMAGLSYIHSKGVAHRDLKLDNFLLNEHFSALLSDFGFAVMDEKHEKLLRETMCGSPAYMAPEVHRANKTCPYEAKGADLYSMGICLFEMINFDKPFLQNNLREIIAMKMSRNYRFHSKLDQTISNDVKDLIYRLLDPEPLKRISIKTIVKHKFFI